MSLEFETRCIHGENQLLKDHPYGAIGTPIFQTATFAHPGVRQSTGYDYTRVSNPTRDELEQVMASLEEGCAAFATSTGMGAVDLIFSLFKRGDHVICSEDLYGGSVRLFDDYVEKVGMSFTYVNTGDAQAVEAAITEHTAALYIETPSNPCMEITDLDAMHEIAKKHGLLLIVDNTFLTPYFQKPIRHGADLVIHSGTKYLAGHNDTLAGFVVVKDPEIAEKLSVRYKTVGNCLSPFDSFLVLRGIKTLAVRLDRQQENAKKIAEYLQKHPKIKQVYYPGLEGSEGYDISAKQTTGFGGMLSIRTIDEKTARQVLEKVKVIMFAESLGGVESLITYPMVQTHADVPVETRERLGITDDFLRMSVGIEHADDLIADLEQALAD